MKITDTQFLFIREYIYSKSLFIDKDEISAIHKLGAIIKIEAHNYIRVEVIRNV